MVRQRVAHSLQPLAFAHVPRWDKNGFGTGYIAMALSVFTPTHGDMWTYHKIRTVADTYGSRNRNLSQCSWYFDWLVVSTPLKNISQLGLLFPIYGKIKIVPNHQPENEWFLYEMRFTSLSHLWPGYHVTVGPTKMVKWKPLSQAHGHKLRSLNS